MNAVSAMDSRTASAIRRAIAEASAGRLAAACDIGERALCTGGDQTALNAMLGMLRCRTGEFEAALRHLQPARTARPDDVSIASNFIMALVESGHIEEAFAAASPELAAADPSLTIARYRGYVAQLLGNSAAAAEAYQAIVAEAPNDWQSWNNLGNARLLTADFDGAIAAFRKSLELNSEPILTWLNLARAHVKAGDLEQAESHFRATAQQFPDDTKALSELHDLLKRLGRDEAELLQVLEDVHRRDPGNPEVLLALGTRRKDVGDPQGAEAAFRSLLRMGAADGKAYLALARLYDHNRPGDLQSLAEEAESASVEPFSLGVIRALAHRRAGRPTEGLSELENVPADFDPQIVQHLRGQFHDQLGEYDAAFAAFTAMNEAHAADPSQPLARAAAHRARLLGRLDQLTPGWLEGWKAEDPPPDRPAPVFLVGFPRSGTTLLDTMLMGHPDVAVMEERPVLQEVSRGIGGFGAIPDMREEDVQAARANYFDAARRYAPVDERPMLVDKSPLQLTQVPLIHRLFPDARFILALRHSADVLLSCYFSNFHLTAAMGNFLRLDTAAEYYDLVFQLWTRSAELLPINVQTIHYERLIEDPESQLQAVTKALGLEWRAEMLDHRRTARSRGIVRTASYAQITKPLYQSSVGRWQHYREQLEPVLPVLRPWAEKFGYEL